MTTLFADVVPFRKTRSDASPGSDAPAGAPATGDAVSGEEQRLGSMLLVEPDLPTWGPKGATRGWWPRRQAKVEVYSGTPEQLHRIQQNLVKSRQISRYQPLYVGAALFSLAVAILAMFVDYHIIHSDIWSRALSDEFGKVPESQGWAVFFKSLQVIFATLAVHFFLSVTGVIGRVSVIMVVFVLTLVMIAGLGFVVANNNLSASTSGMSQVRSIEQTARTTTLGEALARMGVAPAGGAAAAGPAPAPAPAGEPAPAAAAGGRQAFVTVDPESIIDFKRVDEGWRQAAQLNLWLVFVSVIFCIVTVVAALYIQVAERNVKNFVRARDYRHRKKDYDRFVQLRGDIAEPGKAGQAA